MAHFHRLPGPIADIWAWQHRGACRDRDSGQFFHPDGERGASRGRREREAKKVCQLCPVRAQCAAYALATREPYGVWGGFTEHERLRLLREGGLSLSSSGEVDLRRLEARLSSSAAPDMISARSR